MAIHIGIISLARKIAKYRDYYFKKYLLVQINVATKWKEEIMWTQDHGIYLMMPRNLQQTYASGVHLLNEYINGLVQERHISSAIAMELRLSCINPSIQPLSLSNQVWNNSQNTFKQNECYVIIKKS